MVMKKGGYPLLGIVIVLLAGAQMCSRLAKPFVYKPASLSLSELTYMAFHNLMIPWFVLSLGCTLFAGLLWILVIKMLPLSRAYPLLSLNFFFVYSLSWFFFGEHISLISFVGIFLIVVGTLLLRMPGHSAHTDVRVHGATREGTQMPVRKRTTQNMEL